jgi:hypothetical protein
MPLGSLKGPKTVLGMLLEGLEQAQEEKNSLCLLTPSIRKPPLK